MSTRRSYTAVINSSAAPEAILRQLHAAASKKYACGELDNWRDTGVTFVLTVAERRRIEFICAPLLDVPYGELLLNVATVRHWRSLFDATKNEHLWPVVLEVASWLKASDVTHVRWSRRQVPDFESVDSWDTDPTHDHSL